MPADNLRNISHIQLDRIHNLRNTSHIMKRNSPEPDTLSRRERQIMDVLLQLGTASARDIWHKLPDQPTYSTVRKLLSVLEEKGHVKHRQEGKSYIYSSAKPRAKMAETALKRLRDTFFGGSTEQVVSGLLNLKDTELDPAELARIANLIEDAKETQEHE